MGGDSSNREVFYVDGSFDWVRLLEACGSFSLFGEPRILNLRLSGKPEKEGAAVLEGYAKRLPGDAVLIVTLPKLSATDQKAAWFQALEKKGVFMQVWPLSGQPLIAWLDKRMSAKKMLADRSGNFSPPGWKAICWRLRKKWKSCTSCTDQRESAMI